MSRSLAPAFLLLSISLLSAGARAEDASKTPIYKKPLPDHVCVPATRLDAQTSSCDDNVAFLSNARQCWADVQKNYERAAQEYKKQEGLNFGTNQKQDFLSSQAHDAEAIAVQTYMLGLTEQALDDLDKYFDYVVRPDDMDDDKEILRTPCYRDAVVPMDQIAEQMEKKIAELKKDLAAAEERFAITSDRGHAIGATQGGAVGAGLGGKQGTGGPAEPAKKASPTKKSTITGVEEDRKKQGK